jgi:hypothetical protein
MMEEDIKGRREKQSGVACTSGPTYQRFELMYRP